MRHLILNVDDLHQAKSIRLRVDACVVVVQGLPVEQIGAQAP